MTTENKKATWYKLSYEEKNKELIAHEQEMLDMFLEKKAITKEDYDRAIQELQEGAKIEAGSEQIGTGASIDG